MQELIVIKSLLFLHKFYVIAHTLLPFSHEKLDLYTITSYSLHKNLPQLNN